MAGRNERAGRPPRPRVAEPWGGGTPQADLGLPPLTGGWAEETVTIGGRELRVALPAHPDSLLDDPEVQARNSRDGFMPYWAWVWPASLPMTDAVLRLAWEPGTRVLEIGAGTGLTGLAALLRGYRVTFSDHSETAVELAVHNAWRNGLMEADGWVMDWRDPPGRRFPVVLGSDITYELPLNELVLNVLEGVVEPGGLAWIGDPGRPYAAAFHRSALERGFEIKVFDEAGAAVAAPVEGMFALMELRPPGSRRCQTGGNGAQSAPGG